MARRSPRNRPRLIRAGATAATLAAVAAAVVMSGCQSPPRTLSSPSPPDGISPAPATTTLAPTTLPPTTLAPTTLASARASTTTRPTTTTVKASLPPPTPPVSTYGVLQAGSAGPLVVQLQQRLTSLGYWLGASDGQFGTTTEQAVFALQKAAGLPPSGVMDPATTAALAAGTKPAARSTAGHMIEVDLARQLLLIVTDGHLDAALNTSTGGGYVYYDQGSRQVATTPTGHFTTYFQVDGTRVSTLGVLWRPKFFVGGIAIHGDGSVPPHPVSHGCVRVSDQAIDWIWASGSDPIGTAIWVY